MTVQDILVYLGDMKIIILGVASLIILLIGFWLFNSYIYNAKQPTWQAGDNASITGTVLFVDRNQIASDGPLVFTVEASDGSLEIVAVPSFGAPLCAAAIAIETAFAVEVGDEVLVRGTRMGDGSITPCDDPNHTVERLQATTVIPNTFTGVLSDDVSGMQMNYRDRGEGYYIVMVSDEAISGAVYAVHLYEHTSYLAFEAGEASEIPPRIMIETFAVTPGTDVQKWLQSEQYPGNVTLESESELLNYGDNEFAVSGRDGLYAAKVYAVIQGSYAHIITAEFIAEDDQLVKDVENMLATMTWTAR